MPIFTPGQSLFGAPKKAPPKAPRRPLLQMPTQDPKTWEDIEPPKPKRAYYKFNLDGKDYKMPLDDVTKEPSDFDLEQFAYDQENKSLWQKATEPLTNVAGEKLRGMSEQAFEHAGGGDKPAGMFPDYHRYLGGFYGGLAEQADAAASPIGLMTLGGGAAARGLYGATPFVRGIGQAGRAAEATGGALIGGHGLGEMYGGYQEGDYKRMGWGGVEAVLGGAGLYGASRRGPKIPTLQGEVVPDVPTGGLRGRAEVPPARRIGAAQAEVLPMEPVGPVSEWPSPRQRGRALPSVSEGDIGPTGRGPISPRPVGPFDAPGPVLGEILGLPRSDGLQVVGEAGSVVEAGPSRFGLSRPPSAPKPPIPQVGPFYGAIGRRKGVSTDISDVIPGRRDRQQTGMQTYPESMLQERAAARDPEAMIELRRRQILGARQPTTPTAPAPTPPPQAPPQAAMPVGPIHPRPAPPPRGGTVIRSPGEQLTPTPPPQQPAPPAAISPEGLTGPAGDVGPLIERLHQVLGKKYKAPGPVSETGLAPTAPPKQVLAPIAPQGIEPPPPPAGKPAIEPTPNGEQVALALERLGKPELAIQLRANPQLRFKSPSGNPVLSVKEAETVANIFIKQGDISVPKPKAPKVSSGKGPDLEAVTPGKMEEGGIPTPYEGFKNGKILELARHGNPLAITEAHRRGIDKFIRQAQPPVPPMTSKLAVGPINWLPGGKPLVYDKLAMQKESKILRRALANAETPEETQAVMRQADQRLRQIFGNMQGEVEAAKNELLLKIAESSPEANRKIRLTRPDLFEAEMPASKLTTSESDTLRKLRESVESIRASKTKIEEGIQPEGKRTLISQDDYDAMVPAKGNHHVDYDIDNKYTPQELARIQNSGRMKGIANGIAGILNKLGKIYEDIAPYRTVKYGFLYSRELGGINSINRRTYNKGTGHTAIVVNAMEAMERYNPTEAADAIVHRTMHEFAHNLERTEGGTYTGALADVKSRFGSRKQAPYANEIEKLIAGPSGGYHSEIQGLLHDFAKSRGRAEAKPGALRGPAEGTIARGEGQGRPPVRGGQAGAGTSERGMVAGGVESAARAMVKMGLAEDMQEALDMIRQGFPKSSALGDLLKFHPKPAGEALETTGKRGVAKFEKPDKFGPKPEEAPLDKWDVEKKTTQGTGKRLRELAEIMKSKRPVPDFNEAEIQKNAKLLQEAKELGIDPKGYDMPDDLRREIALRRGETTGPYQPPAPPKLSEKGLKLAKPLEDIIEGPDARKGPRTEESKQTRAERQARVREYKKKGKFTFGSNVGDTEGTTLGSGPDPVEFGKRAFRFGKGAYEGARKAWKESGRPPYESAKRVVKEQAYKTKPGTYAHETAREVKYSGKAFLRSFPDIVRGIGQSGLTTLDKMGPGGKALSKIIQQARIYEEQLAARYIKNVDPKNEAEIERLATRAQRETWEKYFRTGEVNKQGQMYYDWEKLDRMIARTEDKTMARDIVNKYFGRSPKTGERYKHAVKSITEFETAVKLSQFYISNIANVVMTGGKANVGAMGKALKTMLASDKTIRGSYNKAIAEASETGALQPILSELKQELGMSKKVGHIFGIDKAERLQRTFASLAGKHTADELFTQIKAGKGGDTARWRLSELLMEDDLSKVINQSKLTEQQRLFAGNRMSEMTQGRASSIDLPPIWTNHPVMNLVTQFKRYAFNQAKNTNQAFKVDPVRMISAITLMGAGVGEAVGDTKAIINGIGRSITNDETLMESIKANLEDRGEGAWRVANNIGDAWALGLMLDFAKSASRGESGVSDFVIGPAWQDFSKLASSVAERKPGEIGRQFLEAVPMFGRGLSQGLAPRNNPQPRRRRY